MAGGGGSDQARGTTLLETPPYVIALVFVFFLVVTICFEKAVLWLKRALKRRRRYGLKAALKAMVMELTVLGVASLILMLFQANIGSYCISSTAYTSTWLDRVHGCACCLAETKGISDCYLENKGCGSADTLGACCHRGVADGGYDAPNATTCADIFDEADWNGPAETFNLVGGKVLSISPSQDSFTAGFGFINLTIDSNVSFDKLSEMYPEAFGPTCKGRVQVNWDECNNDPDKRPAIQTQALNQIHIFIFILALTHIASGVALILVASLRIHFWRRWGVLDDVPLAMVSEAVKAHEEAVEEAVQELDPKTSTLASRGSIPEDSEPSKDAAQDVESGEGDSLGLPSRFEVPRKQAWRGRPEKLKGVSSRAGELAVCIIRQFLPNILTKEEFFLMRASFFLTWHISLDTPFDFKQYITDCLEEDFAAITGLAPEFWVGIILFVLLSTAIGWATWIIIVLAGACLFVINTKLIWVARYATRGGNVHSLKPGIFWLNRPWLLLTIIKSLLFFMSFVFGNTIFFAWQFSASSCFFSRSGFQGHPVEWWVLLLVNGIYLLSLSTFTLPLYSLCVQMGCDYNPRYLAREIVENAHFMQKARVPSRGLRRLISVVVPRKHASAENAAAAVNA